MWGSVKPKAGEEETKKQSTQCFRRLSYRRVERVLLTRNSAQQERATETKKSEAVQSRQETERERERWRQEQHPVELDPTTTFLTQVMHAPCGVCARAQIETTRFSQVFFLATFSQTARAAMPAATASVALKTGQQMSIERFGRKVAMQ